MNRRDLLSRFTGGLAAVVAAPAVTILDNAPDPKRTLVVIRASGRITAQVREHIACVWKQATKDTDWHDVKVVVVDESVAIAVHQK
jgi:hypothetical protein